MDTPTRETPEGAWNNYKLKKAIQSRREQQQRTDNRVGPRIAELKANGLPFRAIAATLEHEQVQTPSYFTNKGWSAMAVKRIWDRTRPQQEPGEPGEPATSLVLDRPSQIEGLNAYFKIKEQANAYAPNQHNVCYPVAITALTGKPYAECDAAVSAVHRRGRTGSTFSGKTLTHKEVGLAQVLAHFGLYPEKDETMPHIKTTRSLLTACEAGQLKGKYAVRFPHHIAAVIDGKLIDWSQAKRKRVDGIYRIKELEADDDAWALASDFGHWLATYRTKRDARLGQSKGWPNCGNLAADNQEKGKPCEIPSL